MWAVAGRAGVWLQSCCKVLALDRCHRNREPLSPLIGLSRASHNPRLPTYTFLFFWGLTAGKALSSPDQTHHDSVTRQSIVAFYNGSALAGTP